MIYNNFFSAAYSLYSKYYEEGRARNRACMFIGVHLLGLALLLVAIFKYFFHLDLQISHNGRVFVYLLISFLIIVLPIKYFGEGKARILLNNFENRCTSNERMWWGIFSIIFLLFEYIIAAIILANTATLYPVVLR
jgi:membrane protein YdbS with pleckstrin-like domain